MQQAKHTGKIVLRIPQIQATISVKENCSYLITGGLGGLGRLATQWLIDKGAGHVVLVSRRKADEEAQSFIEAYQGRVSVVGCDIANGEQLNKVIQNTEKYHGELKGVIHAAGVLSDGVIQQQDWPKFETVFESKIWGTWNLHNSTKDKSLDFFALFSSMASLVGSPGQSNYAAANNYMDQFAAWRQAQGCPALSINWGPWGEVGMAANQRSNTQVHWASQGIYVIEPDGYEAYFNALFLEPNLNSQIGVLDINWIKFTENDVSNTSRNFLEYFAQSDDMEVGCANWVEDILQSESQDQLPLLIVQIKQVVANVLNISNSEAIGLRERFFDLGIDSLMAVELSNKLKKDLRYHMPPTLLFDYPTIESLTNYIAADVLQLQQTKEIEDDVILDDDINDLFSELDEMSDDDATQRLV